MFSFLRFLGQMFIASGRKIQIINRLLMENKRIWISGNFRRHKKTYTNVCLSHFTVWGMSPIYGGKRPALPHVRIAAEYGDVNHHREVNHHRDVNHHREVNHHRDVKLSPRWEAITGIQNRHCDKNHYCDERTITAIKDCHSVKGRPQW